MRKKIIFMLINTNESRTKQTLLEKINDLSLNHEITLLIPQEDRTFTAQIPETVEIEYIKNYQKIKELLEIPLNHLASDSWKNQRFADGARLYFLNIMTGIMKERSLLFKYILNDYPPLEKKYDIAVAYEGPMDFISYFVINKINAEKKVQWIHSDITRLGFNRYFAAKIYKKFHEIFVVTKEGKDKLTHLLPILKNKVDTSFKI